MEILYIFVLHTRKCTAFEMNVPGSRVRNTTIYKIRPVIFLCYILQHFATKHCEFTNFKMLFLVEEKNNKKNEAWDSKSEPRARNTAR